MYDDSFYYYALFEFGFKIERKSRLIFLQKISKKCPLIMNVNRWLELMYYPMFIKYYIYKFTR